MVAYNFRERFVPAIELGRKRQTIRRDRALFGRHARPGEGLQLYTGMRTGSCRLIRDDVICTAVAPCRIEFCPDGQIAEILVGGMRVRFLKEFALGDGFCSLADMSRFFVDAYGAAPFEGVLIEWAAGISPLDRAAA
jgi:hypothetical protein